MKAKTAALMVQAYATACFPDDGIGFEKHCLDNFLYVGDYVSQGSHKYVPTERLNDQLKLPQGAGIFGYVKFDDGSYILQTCSNGLAVWAGGDAVPEFPPRLADVAARLRPAPKEKAKVAA